MIQKAMTLCWPHPARDIPVPADDGFTSAVFVWCGLPVKHGGHRCPCALLLAPLGLAPPCTEETPQGCRKPHRQEITSR